MPGITVVPVLPSFVSKEQHQELTSSTPGSFSELPAVLYHEEKQTSIVLDPPLDGFSEEDCASGTVYILSSVLAFASVTGKCLQVTYPTISLHAISRADLGPSIYCQLDELLNADEEPTGDEEDAMEMRELRINLQNEASLEPMFEALSQCAALHPDENDGEEEEFDDAFLDADEVDMNAFGIHEQSELSETGRATLARLEAVIADPHGHLAAEGSDEEEREGGENVPQQPNGVNH